MSKNTKEKNYSMVRIPEATMDHLKYLLNHEIGLSPEGDYVRIPSPIGLDEFSDAQTVNMALLGFLAGNTDPKTLNYLISQTPKVSSLRVQQASQRLIPNQAVIVPADSISTIMKNQEVYFNSLNDRLIDLEQKNTSRFRFVTRFLNMIAQGIAFMVGYTSNKDVVKKSTFSDTKTQQTYSTLMSFGEDAVNTLEMSNSKLNQDLTIVDSLTKSSVDSLEEDIIEDVDPGLDNYSDLFDDDF